MEDKEFKHFFDAGLAWARKHIKAGDSVKEMRNVVLGDIEFKDAGSDPSAFAAGALYGIVEAEADDDCE